MTLTSNQGPLPTIIAPNGRILAGDPYTDSDRTLSHNFWDILSEFKDGAIKPQITPIK
ncbi:hypothetical protein [Aerosakkonema funiforme]|nr:hypothetical protein [Aerosakkonema funiforme]